MKLRIVLVLTIFLLLPFGKVEAQGEVEDKGKLEIGDRFVTDKNETLSVESDFSIKFNRPLYNKTHFVYTHGLVKKTTIVFSETVNLNDIDFDSANYTWNYPFTDEVPKETFNVSLETTFYNKGADAFNMTGGVRFYFGGEDQTTINNRTEVIWNFYSQNYLNLSAEPGCKGFLGWHNKSKFVYAPAYNFLTEITYLPQHANITERIDECLYQNVGNSLRLYQDNQDNNSQRQLPSYKVKEAYVNSYNEKYAFVSTTSSLTTSTTNNTAFVSTTSSLTTSTTNNTAFAITIVPILALLIGLYWIKRKNFNKETR